MDTKEDGKNKPAISICLEDEVLRLLNERAKLLKMSRSWMINYMLRAALGLPNEQITIKGV
jgi:metal-responsive CopG/Arc/MetJ family transcriptional regulator